MVKLIFKSSLLPPAFKMLKLELSLLHDLRLDHGGFGPICKNVISLFFIKEFKRSIYQMKGYIFLFYVVQTRRQPDVFYGKYKLKSYSEPSQNQQVLLVPGVLLSIYSDRLRHQNSPCAVG